MNHFPLNIRIKYYLHRFHYPIVGGIILLSLVASILLSQNGGDWKIVWPIIGAAISLVYIIEKQQLDEALLFKQLFKEFNERYDAMNERLNSLESRKEEPLSKDDSDLLNDYFNLCGEEYLYYRNGFIYPEVWETWVRGMHDFYSIDSIGKMWDDQLGEGSYYGLCLKSEFETFHLPASNPNGKVDG